MGMLSLVQRAQGEAIKPNIGGKKSEKADRWEWVNGVFLVGRVDDWAAQVRY
jgi:rhamnogalacturonyl hydrolase YesR